MVQENLKAYQQSAEAVLKRWKTDAEKGLTRNEAEIRLVQYGPNELEKKREKSWFRLLFEQFFSPLVWVLLLAALLAFLFQNWLEGTAILIVIVINAAIGFFMEFQASRSMEALRRLSQSTATVIRDGQPHRVPSADLVPGDLLMLEAGDMVPADCRIVRQEQLGVKEAALTGESAQVDKQTEALEGDLPIHDRRNLVFKGTMIAQGNARAVVIATGNETELGAIAHLVQRAEKEATPLEQKLEVLSQRLLWVTLFLAFLIFAIGLLEGQQLYLMLETAIALAVAAIPEGLPIVATIALARGMLRLARHQVIVKKLSAVETLGETQVIFTDKTGTLTENRLSVDTLLFADGEASVSLAGGRLHMTGGQKALLTDTPVFKKLCEVGVLCNNANLGDAGEEPIGDPLEIALLYLAEATGRDVEEIRSAMPRVREVPFSSETKMMGTLHRQPSGRYLACIKGAPEIVLHKSDLVITSSGPSALDNRQWWLERSGELGRQGLRTLALAFREMDEDKEDLFDHLVLIGVIGFLDPPRQEVRPALETCQRAGVEVVMVTGDQPETAGHIAYRTGLVPSEEANAVSGTALEEAFAKDDRERLLRTRIFARVSPAQKLDLVHLYQQKGFTVGMTGDGINDTPALRKADIGIAMGKRGTEAAKEVADLVLEDDAFPSIVLAIRQGRGIFDNIRYFVIYLLSCNLSELLVVSITALAGFGQALLPLQILFLNMVTDVFPALALGMNKESDDVMDRPPRPSDTQIMDRRSWWSVGLYAAGLTVGMLGVLIYAREVLQTSSMMANNLTFYTLIMAQLWHVFNLPKRPFGNEVTRNPYIWLALLLCMLITVVAYIIPVTAAVLELQPLTPHLLWISFLFSLLPIAIIQVFKLLRLV